MAQSDRACGNHTLGQGDSSGRSPGTSSDTYNCRKQQAEGKRSCEVPTAAREFSEGTPKMAQSDRACGNHTLGQGDSSGRSPGTSSEAYNCRKQRAEGKRSCEVPTAARE